MAALIYILAYVALAVPMLFVTTFMWVDFVDPAVIDPNVDYAFWTSGLGCWLFFAAPLVLPALIVGAFTYVLRCCWNDKTTVSDELG